MAEAMKGSHGSTAPREENKVRAVVLEKVKEITVREIEVNEPFGPRDVRIAIKSVGICGSDVHYYQHGSIGPFVVKQPMILGHEAAGVVIEVGAEVQHLKVGDRVCMEPGVPDPNSLESRRGMYNVCRKLRFWATPPYAPNLLADPAWAAGHGCLRSTVVHPADYTYKLPDNVSFDEGAMVEPLAVGIQAATKAKIKPGDIAVVMGAGPIGMMVTLAALAGGCAKVLLGDISEPKLKVGENLTAPGKIVGINVLTQNMREAVLEKTGGWGADIVFECTGNHKAAASCPELACPGGCVVFVGCPSHPVPIEMGHMQVRELRTEAIFRYAHVYPKAIALMESGAVNLKPIITNHFSFEQAVEAFDFMVKPPDTTVKSVIHL
jgi:D-xylulose reductase